MKNSELEGQKNQSRVIQWLIWAILFGKFYFLWGFSTWPKSAAPIPLVFIRDVFVLGFIGYIFRNFLDQQFLKKKWMLFVPASMGLFLGLLHLLNEKSLEIWGQHYLRNFTLPLLIFPAGVLLFNSKNKISIGQILTFFFWIDIAISLLQKNFFPNLMWGGRPTGLLGDPLINSMVLFWGWFSILQTALQNPNVRNRTLFLLATGLFALLIQFLSSVSALLAMIGALVFLTAISGKFRSSIFSFLLRIKLIAMIGVISLVGATFYFSKNTNVFEADLMMNKLTALTDGLLCQGEQCAKIHWSLQGRIKSNMRAIELCQESFSKCLWGNFSSGQYERLDSTVASLMVNWGMLFTIVFFIWIFLTMVRVHKSLDLSSDKDPDCYLWNVIFISSLIFSLFNAVMYRYPVNIFMYLSMAWIWVAGTYHARQSAR